MHRTPEGHAFIRLHYTADETLTPGIIRRFRKGYTTQAHWEREMEINANALDGQRVYPEFDPALHVIRDEDVPGRGCIYFSIDPHPRTPHAMMWLLIDRWSDWYIYRELWPSKAYPTDGRVRRLREDEQDHVFGVRDYVTWIAAFEGNEIQWHNAETADEYGDYIEKRGGEIVVSRFMDQAGKGFAARKSEFDELSYWDFYRKCGIVCRGPKKGHEAGENALHELLAPRKHDLKGTYPRLHIAASCRELIAEFPMHRYKTRKRPSEEDDLKQEARKFRTHMLDNLRYLATSNAEYIRSLESERYDINA